MALSRCSLFWPSPLHLPAASARRRPLPHLRGGNAAETLAAEMAAAATKPFAETATAAAAEAVTSGGYGWLSILPPSLRSARRSLSSRSSPHSFLRVDRHGHYLAASPLPLCSAIDTYLVGALADKEHAGVLLHITSAAIIVQRAGGGLGLARLPSYITSASRALYAAYALASTAHTAPQRNAPHHYYYAEDVPTLVGPI